MERDDFFFMFTFSSLLIHPCHVGSLLSCSPSAMGGFLSLNNPTPPDGSDLLAERSSRMINFLHMPINKQPGSGRDPENVVSVATVTTLDVFFEGRRESPWEGAFLMP